MFLCFLTSLSQLRENGIYLHFFVFFFTNPSTFVQDIPDDLVLQCSPDNPPYSLVCMLQDLLGQVSGLSLETSCHFHSSVAEPLEDLLDFLPEGSPGDKKSRKSLKVKIIWKESEYAA